MVFLKEFFKKVDFEKNQQTTNKYAKLPSRQRVIEALCTYTQGWHRLKKYLNLEGFLEKSLEIKTALKSTGKSDTQRP